MIRVSHLSVGKRLLPFSLQVESGEVLHVVGPNGSGKSTFLNALAGMIEHQGEVYYDQTEIRHCSFERLANYRALLSQSDRPAFNLVVAHYLALSIPSAKTHPTTLIDATVNELADILQLSDKLHRPIHHLSGGEWQRVRLCAICLQIWPTLNPTAKLLILDEPAAPLDIGQESMLYRLIRRVASMGLAVVMSNHDLNRTLNYADRVVLFDKGVMQQFGSPQEVLTEEQLANVFNTHVTKAVVNQKPVLLFD